MITNIKTRTGMQNHIKLELITEVAMTEQEIDQHIEEVSDVLYKYLFAMTEMIQVDDIEEEIEEIEETSDVNKQQIKTERLSPSTLLFKVSI